MHETKRLLLRGITHKALAEESGTSVPYISKIISGSHKPGRDKALNLARCADRLTGLHIFEPTDFNPNLSPNLKNLCDDVRVKVFEATFMKTEILTVEQLLEIHAHNIDLTHQLNLLVRDGQTRVWGSLMLDLAEEEN